MEQWIIKCSSEQQFCKSDLTTEKTGAIALTELQAGR